MLPSQRRQAILAAVRAEDAASAEALARQFDVSVETIRRDLRALHSDGLLERVYGGATRPSGRSSEGSFRARSVRNIELKRAVAALAASLIEPDDTVVIDVGTTALEVAKALPNAFHGRVLTNSVPVAMALAERSDVDLMLCGGGCVGLCDLRFQPPRIQARQELAALYTVSFLHQHGGDPFIVVERELDLSQIHIAVEHEILPMRAPAHKPPSRPGCSDARQHQGHHYRGFG